MKWCLMSCRIQAGLNRIEASKLLKISKSTLANYEMGKSVPTSCNAQRISEIYGISLKDMDFSRIGNSVIQRKNKEINH